MLVQVVLSNLLVATLLALVAAVIGRVLRRPALTHALWLLVLVKLITPPLVLVPMPWPRAGDSGDSQARMDLPLVPAPAPPALVVPNEVDAVDPGGVPRADAGRAADHGEALPDDLAEATEPGQAPATPPSPFAEGSPRSSFSAWPLIGGLWLAGSLLWFSFATRRVVQFERLLRHGRKASTDLQAETYRLANRLSVRCPDVWLVPGTLSPMVWVLGRSRRLLLPQWLLARLSGEQRAAMLVHELAHLRRRDHWVRALELLVLGFYWWCPLVWWAQRELREAEEECCDAWVLWALPGSARAYAHALVDTVDFLSEAKPALSPVASGFGPVHLLRRRLTMILKGKTPRALTWLGVLGVIAVAALLLPLVPTWAQAPRGEGGDPGAKKEGAPEIELQKQHLRKMAEEIERARAELERKSKELQEAMARLRQAEGQLGGRGAGGRGAGGFPGGQPRPDPAARGFGGAAGKGGGAAPDLDRRLKDVENKLDLVLREVLELRRQLGDRKTPGAPGAAPGRPPGLPGATPPPGVPGGLFPPPAPKPPRAGEQGPAPDAPVPPRDPTAAPGVAPPLPNLPALDPLGNPRNPSP